MVIYNIATNGRSTELVIEVMNDTVHVEPSAIAYVTGTLILSAECQSFKDRILALFIGKSLFKPSYRGTGKIYMKATVGTYHKFSIKEETNLVLGKRCFIACRQTISVRPNIRVGLLKFLSGSPMSSLLVKGNGNIVVHMPGPVQEITLDGDKFVAFKDDIAAYSDTLKVSRERAGKGWLKIANQMVKVYRGKGSIFFTPNPNKDAKSN